MALLMNNISSIPSSPLLTVNENLRLRSRVLVRSLSRGDPVTVPPPELVRTNEVCFVNKDVGVACCDDGGKDKGQNGPTGLEPLWDDGYGTQSLGDYIDIAMSMLKSDGGPPRWFCPVACGKPLNDSPVLLYIPGMDGTGAGLVVHEKALGKVFHVQCLNIPSWDRTPLEGLIQIVEDNVMIEHALSGNKPIYMLGESFGGALALAVAARNPTIDLVLILANPATSYERSPLHPLVAFMRTLPDQCYGTFPYITSFLLGDFIKMAMVNNKMDGTNQSPPLVQLMRRIIRHLPLYSALTKIIPKDTLKWRIDLLESTAAYANSRLHAVTAQVLVLASGKDNLIPSKNEAQRLSGVLKHCQMRVYEENGHTILMETGVNVLSAIKTTHMYRRSSKHDILNDFLPPSITDFKTTPMDNWWYRLSMGAAMFSTMADGKIVRGLAGIPDEGPVLLVGNHMLWGFEAFPFVLQFLREKKVVLHALTHPETFAYNVEDEYLMIPYTDILKLFGAVPVSARNLFRLLSRKSYILLYPGGAREAFHRKGEACKLFWPDKQEFVRMAVKFGATIVPFGVVGEDDISELMIDYDEMKINPLLNRMVNELNKGRKNVRKEMGGEISKQKLHFPIFLPKLPGRLYYMFGKPIRTKGKENMVHDKAYLEELYLQIKCNVENNMAYLLNKREEDPYRGFVERLMWVRDHGSLDQIPSFEP
ncbi:acyltransferase-like protein At1g54570, chloroplastic isoform X1 [Helianthus annuus]|nr:acyltransferase-like protein At1g54570, chloroplastic isoform X1 [Helianthus annuus]